MCNSIDCPNGYTPIHDAMTVECDDDPCQVSQCCEAFCLYHPCPNNFTPVFDAGTTMCPGSGCTDDLCCGEYLLLVIRLLLSEYRLCQEGATEPSVSRPEQFGHKHSMPCT